MRLEPPSWWYGERVPLAAWALWPISAAYAAMVESRFRSASPYGSKLPVICVGNFTMGGAGKTPMALKLASLLRKDGFNPGFLTRGYGGSDRGPHLVDFARDGADRVGDEPLLLAGAAPTVVSRDRPAGAKLLETLDVDAIIMDDGFQNPSLEKDLSLVVVDGGAGIGCGHVFPLGPLRGSLNFQLGKADAVVILGEDRSGVAALLKQRCCDLRRDPLPVLNASLVPVLPGEARGRRFLAFCGIGRPAKFFETLREAGIAVVKRRSFPDHHPYAEADARSLLAEAKALSAGLITTEKDLARLEGANGVVGELHQSVLTLPISVEFAHDSEAHLSRWLTSLSSRKPVAAIRDRYNTTRPFHDPG